MVPDLEQPGYLGARDINRLREYFLRGHIDQEYLFSKPGHGGPVPFLFRVWLHPDRSRETFDAALREATALGLEYTAQFASALANHPPPSFDDVAPRFWELLFLHPERKLRAPSGVLPWTKKVVPVHIHYGFTPSQVLILFVDWLKSDNPSRNPICKFLIARLEDLGEQKATAVLTLLDQETRKKAMLQKVKRISKSTDDPRFETVQTVAAMTEGGKLPLPVREWVQKIGIG